MGWNTSVIVLNDALDYIADDPEFGKKLARAVSSLSIREGAIDVTARNHCNAASVIETHHADLTTLVAFGQNHATPLLTSLYGHYKPEDQVEILRSWADNMGYRLVRKPQPK